MQRGRVVDSVAHVADHVLIFLECQNDALLLARVHFGIERCGLNRLLRGGFVHRLQLRAGEDVVRAETDRAAGMLGDQRVVSGDDPKLHAHVFQVRDGLGGIRLWRIEEQQEPDKCHFALVRNGIRLRVLDGDGLFRNAEHPETLPAPVAEALLNLRQGGFIQRMIGVVQPRTRAGGKHLLERAFGDQPHGAAFLNDHAHAFAIEIVRDFAALDGACCVDGLERDDRLIQRVDKPRLQAGVEVGRAKYIVRVFAVEAIRAVEVDHAFGQRSGLVGAERVHAAEVLNRGQPAHDDPRRRHDAGTARERDVDDGGQQLRRDADRKRHGKQQRIDDGLVKQHVDDEDEHGQNQHHGGEQISEPADAALKLRLRLAGCDLLRYAAELRSRAGERQ